jgi:hypothetical protein
MERCGVRAHYYKHLSGICMRAPHGDDVEHLIEMVTPDTGDVDYTEFSKKDKDMSDISLQPLPTEGKTPVSFDLLLDGTNMDQTAGWRTELMIDFDQFESDQHFAAVVSDHIQTSLEHLAREVEEMALRYQYQEMPPCEVE